MLCRLELGEKHAGGWFILPTVITGLTDQSRYTMLYSTVSWYILPTVLTGLTE